MNKMLALMSAAALLFGIAAMSIAQDKAGGKMGDGKMGAKTTKPVTKTTKKPTKPVTQVKKPATKATTKVKTTGKMSDTKGKMAGDKK